MHVLLSTAYFPPIEWLARVVQSKSYILEAHEHFQSSLTDPECTFQVLTVS
jgi:hypothetical protein